MTKRCPWLLLLVPLALPVPATACTIPVFRYALENWRPSNYELLVFHRGQLTDTQLKTVRQAADDSGTPANRVVTTVDLDAQPSKAHLAVWERQPAGTKLPWAVLRYPDSTEKTPDAWAGPFNPWTAAFALYSPTRKCLIDHIGEGASAVFLLLESGDEKADNAAAELVSKELARLEKAVELPKQDPTVSPLESALPLKIRFPLERRPRTLEDEQAFVTMLLRSEAGLEDVRGPIVFVVFGRGRLLCALHGKDLTPERLEQAARFLCAACSCRVKELNPGVDLLLTADWQALLDTPRDPSSPADDKGEGVTTPLVVEQPDLWSSPPVPGVADATASQVAGERTWLWLAVGGAAVFVVATGAWALLTLTRQPPENPTP